MFLYYVFISSTVLPPIVVILPSDPIQGAMVGNPQIMECRVSTVSGVESSSVMIMWMGPGGDTITNDSRVTISPTSSSGNNYSSSIQFTYLMEGDNGTYTCNVTILEVNESASVVLESISGKWIYITVVLYCSSNSLLMLLRTLLYLLEMKRIAEPNAAQMSMYTKTAKL